MYAKPIIIISCSLGNFSSSNICGGSEVSCCMIGKHFLVIVLKHNMLSLEVIPCMHAVISIFRAIICCHCACTAGRRLTGISACKVFNYEPAGGMWAVPFGTMV